MGWLLLLVVLPALAAGDAQSEETADTIVVDALGRTFTLGMLYDRRADRILPGKTLWTLNQLQTNISRREFQSSRYQVQMRDSIEDKARLMEIETSIKVSFLFGLMSVEGSARYFKDYKSSNYDARVTLKFDAATRFEQLTMSHLDPAHITYPEVLDDDEATHVVVGIQYGAQAYFIFEKSVNSSYNRQEMEVELDFVATGMGLLQIGVGGAVEIDKELATKVNGLKIRFHGDFVLPRNPTTFEEAVKLYQTLPDYVTGPNAQSVPKKIYLYPLKKIDPNRVFSTIREISDSLIADAVAAMQDLEDARIEANDLYGSVASNYIRFFRLKISVFQDLLQRYKLQFQGQIGRLLVQIRGNGQEERELANFLEAHSSSPFSKSNIETWMGARTREGSLLETYIRMLNRVSFCKDISEYLGYIMSNDEVVGLNILFPNSDDPVLTHMDNFLGGSEDDYPNVPEQWFERFDILQNLRVPINNILYYMEANREESIIFTWVVLTQSTQIEPMAEIKAHRSDGTNETFIPPRPPQNLTETVVNESIMIYWNPPEYGADFLEHYEISVTKSGYGRGILDDEEPTVFMYQVPSTVNEFQITNPHVSVPYDVSVYGLGRVGRTGSSEILHHNGVEVRLVGGAEICSPRKAHGGRIEVLHNSIWGTVCGERWTDKEAEVACRMMDFIGGVARQNKPDLQGSGQIWMAGVQCSGSESNLDECEFHWAVEGECNHTMDVVVECYGGQPTGNVSTPEQCNINELQDQLALSRSNLNLMRSNLNMAREELHNAREEFREERNARTHDLRSINETVGQINANMFNMSTKMEDEMNARIQEVRSVDQKISKPFSVAFHALLTRDVTIGKYSTVKFDYVKLNNGSGYNRNTGYFTVPTGKAGLYYFSVHLRGHSGWAFYELKSTKGTLCQIEVSDPADNAAGGCSATVQLSQGNIVYLRRLEAIHNSPLSTRAQYRSFFNGFTGFLLKPDD